MEKVNYNRLMILFSNIHNLPIFSIREGVSIGQIEEIIINPDNGRVLGFKLIKTHVRERNILTVGDIREINPDVMIIDDSQNLATENEVIKIAEILKEKIKWIGLKVETDLGRKLGRVEDLALDTKTMNLTRIYTSGGIIKETFSLEKIIIPAHKIISISPKVVIVEDDYIKTKAAKQVSATETA
ncbi:MAG: PRC-barrel domain protein [candidate division CPR2 bacterium GW2011_GWC1_41_48]|uniref:PRC-barrel domain protein n=1 Tax=candidate division CPR2 bacterium GW2011_GWC1_41_48 TaxID=1618344 RepID=A0A0G0W8L6_UNCC2|nr:MAG: PRC-barrel domain protein [candidate division CPR2 bacterium GW2011_GWC2_39_35]KKR28538.1 MAG: PRC-barrel domain protein [candidate division CPR2 bacterium GW2011_GWD2_39_7]KKS09334.1 MAG: PRC-barrel domain protein [candidate division CPR2 bacterium GW2011_GWC1_41_48]